ncbi:MAG: hypothetical protein SF052_21905 [Bacteroidia bacterium]|nr:hypothetical protein [Bacteroidia bacterium]
MKSIFSGILLLTGIFFFSPNLRAQSETEIVTEKVNLALGQYLKKVYPPKNCDLNDCAFFYKNDMIITKNQEVGAQLRLWGKAKVTYRNSRTGGDGLVYFYAEIEKIEGVVTVTGLKWRTGECMKFEPLM